MILKILLENNIENLLSTYTIRIVKIFLFFLMKELSKLDYIKPIEMRKRNSLKNHYLIPF